jgi:phosphoribosylanthranilate isomerase
MNKPYLGVSGLVTVKEIKLLVDLFERNGFNIEGSRIPMVGILVSYRSIDLGFNPSSRRYPSLRDIPRLLEATENKTFNTIHFNTKRPEVLHQDIEKLLILEDNYDRGLIHGIQFNLAWPLKEEIDIIKKQYPKLKTIFQLSNYAMENLQLTEVTDRLNVYPDIDYILIDPSGGKGLGFDLKYSSEIYRNLKRAGFNAIIGFAGGLSGENVAGIILNLKENLNTIAFSIDAEGRLRDKKSDAHGDDDLSPEKVRSYIENSAHAFLDFKCPAE